MITKSSLPKPLAATDLTGLQLPVTVNFSSWLEINNLDTS